MGEIAVAPLVGAWIETDYDFINAKIDKSLPSWERGLKPLYKVQASVPGSVAPLVGAWIETIVKEIFYE